MSATHTFALKLNSEAENSKASDFMLKNQSFDKKHSSSGCPTPSPNPAYWPESVWGCQESEYGNWNTNFCAQYNNDYRSSYDFANDVWRRLKKACPGLASLDPHHAEDIMSAVSDNGFNDSPVLPRQAYILFSRDAYVGNNYWITVDSQRYLAQECRVPRGDTTTMDGCDGDNEQSFRQAYECPGLLDYNDPDSFGYQEVPGIYMSFEGMSWLHTHNGNCPCTPGDQDSADPEDQTCISRYCDNSCFQNKMHGVYTRMGKNSQKCKLSDYLDWRRLIICRDPGPLVRGWHVPSPPPPPGLFGAQSTEEKPSTPLDADQAPVMFHSRHGESYANVVMHNCKTAEGGVVAGTSSHTIRFEEIMYPPDTLVAWVKKDTEVGPGVDGTIEIYCNKKDLLDGDYIEPCPYDPSIGIDYVDGGCSYRLKESFIDPHLTFKGIVDTIAASHYVSKAAKERGVEEGARVVIVTSALRRTIETAALLYHWLASDNGTCPDNVAVTYTQFSQEIVYDSAMNGDAQLIAVPDETLESKAGNVTKSIEEVISYFHNQKDLMTSSESKHTIDQAIGIVRCMSSYLSFSSDQVNGPQVNQQSWFTPYASDIYTSDLSGMMFVKSRTVPMFDYILDATIAISNAEIQFNSENRYQLPEAVFLVNHQGVMAHSAVRQQKYQTSVEAECISPSTRPPFFYEGAGGAGFDQEMCPCKLEAHNSATYEVAFPCGFFKNQIFPLPAATTSGADDSWSTFKNFCHPPLSVIGFCPSPTAFVSDPAYDSQNWPELTMANICKPADGPLERCLLG